MENFVKTLAGFSASMFLPVSFLIAMCGFLLSSYHIAMDYIGRTLPSTREIFTGGTALTEPSYVWMVSAAALFVLVLVMGDDG
jgi:hypothetical protein